MIAAVVTLGLTATACDSYTARAAPSLTPVAQTGDAAIGPADCAGVAVDDPVVVVETLTGVAGCVPPTQALIYRCEPIADPVLELDPAGDARRFLGGAHAVAIPGPPEGARAIGVSTLGRVFDLPDDPRFAYVVAGDRTERWLALPDRAQVGTTPTASLVGDSIMEGAQTELIDGLTGWQTSVDAVIGRSSSGGIAPVESWTPPPPDVVVVELGVNDQGLDAFVANAQRTLEVAAAADMVVWVTPHGPDAVTAEIDRAIPELVGALPNGQVADWNAAVPLDALSSDGVHLDTGSTHLFADFLLPILREWLDAVRGTGATRCADDVSAGVNG